MTEEVAGVSYLDNGKLETNRYTSGRTKTLTAVERLSLWCEVEDKVRYTTATSVY